jgi:hypothetical protein
VPLPVTGNVTFRLVPSTDGKTAALTDGLVDGHVILAGGQSLVSATLSGTVDCNTHRLTANLDGKFSLTPGTPPLLPFSGTYDGIFDGTKFSGTWSEAEPVNVMGNYPYKGSGTWSATSTSP